MNALIDRWVARVRAVFTKPALDAEFDSELGHHLELHTSALIKEGMAPDEAGRQARIALGGIEQLKELHRDVRGLPILEQVGRDLNYGLRVLNRERGFAADGPEVPSGNEMYLSLHQLTDTASWDMMVRTKLPVDALTAGLRGALRPIDPTLPLTKVRPMQELVDRTLSSRRLLVWLIGGFAAIAVGLSALGLYGVISYRVTQQTKEIGIRMALGADAATVQGHVILETVKRALCGLALGIGAAFVASRGLNSMLFGVSAQDPTNYLLVTVTLLACAFFAGYIPARHASRVDPMIALRTD